MNKKELLRPISGFPEFLPADQILYQHIISVIREKFELFGFAPVETPSVERTETLVSKGGTEKEIYTLSRLAAEEGEDDNTGLSMHFDLTVPLARYVSQHYNELSFPFRRYQIQKIWRGERPQEGRFREFLQCDIDIIGNETLDSIYDAELPVVMYQIFSTLEIGDFVIRLNNRKIFQGFLEGLGLAETQIAPVFQAIDKLEKIGLETVSQELLAQGIEADISQQILDFVQTSGTTDQLLSALKQYKISAKFSEGVKELEIVVQSMRDMGVPDTYFAIDLTITRGLDYYTGTVYETQLVKHPHIGSICSGGRYENLASHFTDKALPGVGISIGLTRLFTCLLKTGVICSNRSTFAQVLITTMKREYLPYYFEIAQNLRDSGMPTEIYLENKKFPQQMKYADQKNIPFVLIAGENEYRDKTFTLKNLQTGKQRVIPQKEIIAAVWEERERGK